MDNIEKDLQEIGCDSADCINLVLNMDQCQAFVNVIMNLRFP
jgi:hypothetical protein